MLLCTFNFLIGPTWAQQKNTISIRFAVYQQNSYPYILTILMAPLYVIRNYIKRAGEVPAIFV